MLRKILPFLALMLALLVATNSNATPGGTQYRVRANLDGPGLASGKAVYRERTRANGQIEQRFTVEVEDAAPGTVMAVVINGTTLGMIVVNDLGIGELEYRTPAFNDDPDVDPIPDNFPHLAAGNVITVGTLSGSFR